MVTLRTITKNDVHEFWRLRLEGLLRNPESFSASYEESVNLSIEFAKDRIGETEQNYVIGAFDENNSLAGMAGFRREQTLKLKHKAFIWGVYVTDKYRGQGIGKRMLEEIITRSRQLHDLKLIYLSATANNEPAKRLYQSLGFKTYGIEKNALKVGEAYLDEEWMALHFD
jgi:ribosomal protein S18 acetylase RimI-like enzyme